MGVSTLQVDSKPVIVVDCSNLPNVQIIDTLHKGSALVATQPEKSAYIITNVTNCKLDAAITTAVKDYAKSTRSM